MDAETGGKKSGGTHFSISAGELFLDYEYFESEAGANAKLNEQRRFAKKVIEEGALLGSGGGIAGAFFVTEDVSTDEHKRYCLKWSKTNRYSEVCSASGAAVEEFRTDYDL